MDEPGALSYVRVPWHTEEVVDVVEHRWNRGAHIPSCWLDGWMLGRMLSADHGQKQTELLFIWQSPSSLTQLMPTIVIQPIHDRQPDRQTDRETDGQIDVRTVDQHDPRWIDAAVPQTQLLYVEAAEKQAVPLPQDARADA